MKILADEIPARPKGHDDVCSVTYYADQLKLTIIFADDLPGYGCNLIGKSLLFVLHL